MLQLSCLTIEGRTGHETGRLLLAQLYRENFCREMPTIDTADRGKPYFCDHSAEFSITHTPRHAFCVLADHPVGIDAEEIDRKIDLRLADKILSPAERQRFDAASDPRDFLLRLWVLKEALVKCSGEGLRGYPNFTDFSPEDPRIRVLAGCYVAIIEEERHAV